MGRGELQQFPTLAANWSSAKPTSSSDHHQRRSGSAARHSDDTDRHDVDHHAVDAGLV